MRLSFRFALVFLVGMGVIMGVFAWSVFRREVDLFMTDTEHDNRMIGSVFAVALGRTWRESGPLEAQALIDAANARNQQIVLRWCWLGPPDAPQALPGLDRVQLARLQHGQAVATIDTEASPAGVLRTFVPVDTGGRAGALELTESLEQQHRYTRATLLRISTTTGIIVVVSFLLALVVGLWFVARPIHTFTEVMRAVARGDLSRRPVVRQHDELGELGRDLNAMCDQLSAAYARAAAETAARIAALEQLRHADRLRTIGQLTSGIAHELGTPLNVVWARAKMIATGEAGDDEARACAGIIVDQSARMTAIIRQLLSFARPRAPSKARVDPCQVVRQTFGLLEPAARKQRVELVLAPGEAPGPVEVDADQLQQVLSNLVLNAIQAMPAGGTVTLTLRSEEAAPPDGPPGRRGSYLRIDVRDEGVGISEENQAQIFEPFFTTKGVGEGTGLGLSVSAGIIREHGGWISVASRPGAGACFSVFLPRG